MKMTELRQENESLKQQLQLLTQQKEGEKDSTVITQLKDKNRSQKKTIKDLKAEKVILSAKIQSLEQSASSREQDYQALRKELDHVQQQLSELSASHATTVTEFETLRADQAALQEKASQLPLLQAELDRLQQVENDLREKTTQVINLQAKLDQQGRLVEEVTTKASQEVAELKEQSLQKSREMELVRNGLLSELDAHRDQTGVEIATLQAQKNSLVAKVTELTEKLKLVATHLERQISEKRKIASQYDTTVKEYQVYKEKSEKQITDLMSLLQKMAAELDAARAAQPTQEVQPITLNRDKSGNPIIPSAADKPQRQLQDLQSQLAELDQLNARQARELAALSARTRRIDRALSTPFGRLVSQMLGLKD